MGKVRDRLLKKLEQKKIEQVDKFERWNELPPEVKWRCIETLDFKTRFLLRGTSRSHRKLIDSKGFTFDKIAINSGSDITAKWEESDKTKNEFKLTSNEYRSLGKYFPFLVHIFKKCTINELHIDDTEPFNSIEMKKLDVLVPLESIHVHNLMFDRYNYSIVYLLKKCWRHIDSVHILADGDYHWFREFMKIPAFDYTLTFKTGLCGPKPPGFTKKPSLFGQNNHMDCYQVQIRHFLPMIENWIVNNAPFNKKIVADNVAENSIQALVLKFQRRVIYYNRSPSHKGFVVRFCTDNPSKHIIASVDQDVFYCSVVSSELEIWDFDSYMTY